MINLKNNIKKYLEGKSYKDFKIVYSTSIIESVTKTTIKSDTTTTKTVNTIEYSAIVFIFE